MHPTDHNRKSAFASGEVGGMEEGHGAEHERKGLVGTVRSRLVRIAVLTTTLVGIAVSGGTSLRLM